MINEALSYIEKVSDPPLKCNVTRCLFSPWMKQPVPTRSRSSSRQHSQTPGVRALCSLLHSALYSVRVDERDRKPFFACNCGLPTGDAMTSWRDENSFVFILSLTGLKIRSHTYRSNYLGFQQIPWLLSRLFPPLLCLFSIDVVESRCFWPQCVMVNPPTR